MHKHTRGSCRKKVGQRQRELGSATVPVLWVRLRRKEAGWAEVGREGKHWVMSEDIRRSREESRHQTQTVPHHLCLGTKSLDSPSWVVLSPHHRGVLDRDNVQILETCEPCWAKELPSLCPKGRKECLEQGVHRKFFHSMPYDLQMNWEGLLSKQEMLVDRWCSRSRRRLRSHPEPREELCRGRKSEVAKWEENPPWGWKEQTWNERKLLLPGDMHFTRMIHCVTH